MEHEAIIRFAVFLALFAVLASAEALAPRLQRKHSRRARWLTNWGIILADTITLRLLAIALPLLAIGAALDAEAHGWGLFNAIGLPAFFEILIAILLLDLLIWAQHVVTHKVPLLWRLHRVHHADPDFDVSTAIRFHPIEIALSMLLKIGAVYILGPAPLAVLLFEILLNGMSMFNHANLRLPRRIETLLRRVIVTPDMHMIHHSTLRTDHDSNYGFSLSIWDRLFGTYREQPEGGEERFEIGLDLPPDSRPTYLGWALLSPFRK